jgi:hypothetical protein
VNIKAAAAAIDTSRRRPRGHDNYQALDVAGANRCSQRYHAVGEGIEPEIRRLVKSQNTGAPKKWIACDKSAPVARVTASGNADDPTNFSITPGTQ